MSGLCVIMSQLLVMSVIWGMGGGMKSQTCNNIACRIWDFCTKKQLWLLAAHMPGTVNIEADKQCRVLEDATEWKLNPALFQKVVE